MNTKLLFASNQWVTSRENIFEGLRPGKTQIGLLSYRD